MIGSNYIFIDIPKTATTAVVDYLIENTECREPFHNHIHLISYIDILGMEYVSASYVFTIIRNPYARLVSIWKYYNKLKYNYYEIDPSTPTRENDPHRLEVLKYLTKSPCFDSFIEDILNYDPPRDFRKRIDYDNKFPYLDVINKSQSKLLYPMSCVNRVIDFDNFDQGWASVCGDMGWEYTKLPKVNTSGGPGWETFYSKKQKDRLREVILPELQLWRAHT